MQLETNIRTQKVVYFLPSAIIYWQHTVSDFWSPF